MWNWDEDPFDLFVVIIYIDNGQPEKWAEEGVLNRNQPSAFLQNQDNLRGRTKTTPDLLLYRWKGVRQMEISI